MGLQVEIALLCIINAVWIQHILCDGASAKSETNKWTCTCSITRQQNSNFIPANCSSSCDCSPAVRVSKRENRWTCICSNGGFPRLVGEDNGTSCFTACDCNAGPLSELQPSKKWVSSKVVVIVLLLCLVLMALAFVASVLWFVYRKDKHSIQWTSPSSDRLTSCSSAINLMSRGSSSVPLGMAKHLHNDGILSCSSSPARMQGTFGYFAPEYAIVGRASLKSDVFSFGVVLLELVTGRKPIYKSSNKGEESLVIWATPRLHDSKRVILELPDPRLKGAFPEEEMQIMAYLAKECLLLDPDSRPSMSEVVQILSIIAPNKSKRKKLPLPTFQYSSAGGMESAKPKTCDDEFNDTSATEEIKQITFETPACCLSPTNPDSNNICMTKNEKEADDNYSNDIEKLMLLTSKSRSWRLRDDEVVDITEPRFESFSLPNVDSHIVEIT